ncbi:MAG: LPS export ABC transporter ATP-binding protein [SAR324 cluster bacterium]|uniref:LPS export ABC transporter ATP-binding protein n=1 Tax=SAR324 cluster bacterium TaxID=2024889 RepID=A0A7X9IME4_9DELT|nr:LPS export ABC transporter ATP-binding protein [SAR324 cluster bacterium]
MGQDHRLCTDNVTKIYGGRKVVNKVSITVQSSEIVGLLGPNGAGKTTTFYMCVGLIAPDGGYIFLDNTDVTKEPVYLRARQGIGYLAQEPSVFRKLTVYENIYAILETMDFPSTKARQLRAEQLLEELGLSHLAGSVASSLSGGERRRCEITRALAREPHFILLDEPFAGIDPMAIKDIQELVAGLSNRGIGVLITDHNVRETLGICHRAYILVDGKVLEEGSPELIASSSKARRYYLGDDFSL